jgi:hypothetical protein
MTRAEADRAVDELNVSDSGMRPSSMDVVRIQRAGNETARPIEVDIYPDVGAILADGRHRLAVARELGDDSIEAIVRVYDDEANVIVKVRKMLEI